MTDALYVSMLLVELYIAIGVILIGFGYMVAGKIGGSRFAAFYFGRPLRWAGQRVRSMLAWTLTSVGLVLVWISRRLAYRLRRGLRWLAGTRRRITVTVGVLVLCALTLLALATSGPAGAHTVTVRARGHNMFFVDIVLNDRVKVRGLIDTGATFLSMCATTTAPLGLVLSDRLRMRTANGVITNRKTTVQSVRIGSLEVRNVVAVVDERPSCDTEVLVGMSVLRQLHMTVDHERLTLKARSGEAAPQPSEGMWWLLSGVCGTLLVTLLIVRRMHVALGRRRPWAHQTTAATPLRFRSFFD